MFLAHTGAETAANGLRKRVLGAPGRRGLPTPLLPQVTGPAARLAGAGGGRRVAAPGERGPGPREERGARLHRAGPPHVAAVSLAALKGGGSNSARFGSGNSRK